MLKIENENIIFKTIKQNVSAEIVEKKSRFIAHIFYVESTEEADIYIKQIKKEYNDARHNCFAYAIETGDGGIAVKYNDDGEPQGTAGAPMLKLILEQGLSNILVIVTRYFGGILLGTGGLVRAYSGAVEEALKNSEIIQKARGYEAKIQIDYNYLEPLKYYLEKMNIRIVNIEYLEKIEIVIEILKEFTEKITNNYENENFKISKFDIIKEKFVEIWSKKSKIGKNFKKTLALLVKTYYNAKCKYFTIIF